jgi:predicted MFS family arabinose efflux permease
MHGTTAPANGDAAFAIAPGRRTYILILLTVIYTLAFIDRQIINILAEPIKTDLHLADWQMGALSGFAFALLYTTFGLPAARLTERGNRSWIIAGAVTLWSAFTALSGLATSFAHLLLARTGVGIGEAGCVPAAHSLISDITPKDRRASALAIFSMGLPLGSLVGLAMGGVVAGAFGWRTAFFLVGLPGLALAALTLLTVRDPRPSGRAVAASGEEVLSVAGVFRHLRRRPSFVWMTLGAALLAATGYAHQTFYGSFFLRNHGLALDHWAAVFGLGNKLAFLGIALGLIIGIAGTMGTGIGGRMADRAAAIHPSGYMTVPAWSTLIAIPFLVAAFLVPSAMAALALLLVPHFMKAMWYGPVFACVQGMVAPRSRATAIAVFLFFVNAIGLGMGPVVAGAMSDVLARTMGADHGLRVAMIVFSVMLVAAAACFRKAGRTLADDLVS